MKYLPDINPIIDSIGIMITSCITAYFLGRLYLSKLFTGICDKLKIRSSALTNVWAEIMPNDYPMKIICYAKNIRYEGYIQFIDSYVDNPKITLAAYKIFKNDTLIRNASDEYTYTLLIDTAKMDRIEVCYDKRSKVCIDIKEYCEFTNKDVEQEN